VGNLFEESILGHGRWLENCSTEIQRVFHWRRTADRAIKTGQERRNKTN
jgi:hypothetical protein